MKLGIDLDLSVSSTLVLSHSLSSCCLTSTICFISQTCAPL